ncbi:MAG: alpha/beta hydrolase [bacterium]|nr:alpha/beta hydrolase [bacterium]
MSLLYSFAETACYGLNRLPGGGVKKLMDQGLTTSTGKEKLPAWVKRQCRVREVSLQGFPVYIIRRRSPAKRTNRAVLFLAGGGGMSRPTFLHYHAAVRMVKDTGATVYFPFYPLAPQHNASEAISWLEKVYRGMLRRYLPEQILFAGDSAGANLALSLTGRVAERPCKLILISPAFGVQNGEARDIRLKMEKRDPLLSVAMNDCICENWARGIPLDSPDISPEFVDYRDFPEMLVFFGSHELFYPGVKKGLEKIAEEGVKLYTVEKPMCHDWALCFFFREGREALSKMCDFI